MPIQQGMNQMSPAAINTIRRGVKSTTVSAFGGMRRRRRKAKTTNRPKRASGKRGRKLKFGSPAWRKKYLKK